MRFWQHPTRGFLPQRLAVETSTWDEDPEDALPVEPDALRLWQVGDGTVRARLRGAPPEEVTAAELVRGTVPPRPLGDGQVAAVATVVERLVAESAPHRSAPAESPTDEATLTTNWRSDPRLLDGLATVFRTAALGDPRIAVVPVRPGRSRALLGPAADPEPVEIRVLPRAGLPLYRGGLRAPQARSTVAADVADQVVRVLRSGATLQPPSGGAPRPLRHGDLAGPQEAAGRRGPGRAARAGGVSLCRCQAAAALGTAGAACGAW